MAGVVAILMPPTAGAVTEGPAGSAASFVIRWPLTGLTGSWVGAMQALVGVGSLLWLVIGARLADRRGIRALLSLFAVFAATKGVYATGLELGATGPLDLALFAVATLPGAAALFACLTVTATSMARLAGPSATLTFVLNGATVFLGQGIGIAMGGFGFAIGGLPGAAVSGGCLGLAGMALAARLSARAKRPA